MRARLAVSVVLGLGIALSATSALAEEGGAKAVDAAWLKAVKANDVEALVACYAPDAVMWLPGMPEARGTKAIREAYAGLLAANTVADAALTNAVYQTSGNLSAAWGNFTLTLKPRKGGDTVVMKGRFTVAAKKAGGKWQYVADQASAEPLPPAPPAAK